MKQLCMMLAAAAIVMPLQQAFSMPINEVSVQVFDVNKGTSVPLLEKMSSSMQIVAEQLFKDKTVEATEEVKDDYSRLIGEIGDRVFTGYDIQNVNLEIGSRTEIKLYIRPWSDVVRHTSVELVFSGLSPRAEEMLKKMVPDLENELEQIVTGASIDAVDWAGSILRRKVREKLEAKLPEFKAAVDLVQDGKTNSAIVQVVVHPTGEAVRGIVYEMHSASLPNLILMKLKYKYSQRCNELRGLPVGYVKSHQTELEKALGQELLNEPEVRRFDLKPSVSILPGIDSNISISLNSEKYKIWLEGYADIGRKDDNLSGKAHIGKYISRKDELFVEEELITDDVHWSTSLGYARSWGKGVLTYRRRIPEADNVYRLEYALSPKWGLRAEHFSGNNRNEYALRYRIHEFLSAEYVYGGKKSYFRIIGNL